MQDYFMHDREKIGGAESACVVITIIYEHNRVISPVQNTSSAI